MLIKKLYNIQNLQKRIDLYSSGNLGTAFSLGSTIFLFCECRFWMSSNKIMVITVDIESKETMSGCMIRRKLSELEIKDLMYIMKRYFRSLPEQKLIYIYDE
jgi:hypothetical protein